METINEKGKQEIREFLAANHKLGGDRLGEAIDHALEVARKNQGTPCGDEHMQLAKWLQELQNWRSLMSKEQIV